MSRLRIVLTVVLTVAFAAALAACSSGDGDATPTTQAPAAQPAAESAAVPGVRLVSTAAGQEILGDPPADLVVLDVRTPDEFDTGHLEGAIAIDFYADDFAQRIAELDPDVPYLLYCRSGNRSGQTAGLMAELGFRDVADVDGGVIAWANAGLPLTTD